MRLSEGESKGSSGDELEGDKGGVGGEAGIGEVDVESDGDEDGDGDVDGDVVTERALFLAERRRLGGVSRIGTGRGSLSSSESSAKMTGLSYAGPGNRVQERTGGQKRSRRVVMGDKEEGVQNRGDKGLWLSLGIDLMNRIYTHDKSFRQQTSSAAVQACSAATRG